jgi:hypothetical protein
MANGTAASPILDCFREFARRYSIAHRAYDNARSTERSMDRREAALSEKQAIESEFAECFQLRREPNWQNVEAAARGDTSP